jgi:hypothetical protein
LIFTLGKLFVNLEDEKKVRMFKKDSETEKNKELLTKNQNK